MARPRKKGLDYFPFDVDFFEDEKIVAIAGEFGIKGEMAAIKLLCAVYRNGYYIEWTDMLQAKLLRQMPGVSAELLCQIINRLVRWGFFDASLFDSVKVLSSEGIQRRYFEVTKRCQRVGDWPYLLVNVTLTPINATLTQVNAASIPQIKENKTKKKKSPNGDAKEDGAIPGLDVPRKKEPKQKEHFTAPTLEDVLAYFKENAESRVQDWEQSAKLFYDSYAATGWLDKFGNRVVRWDSAANNWIFFRESNEKKTKPNEDKQTDRFSERRGTEPGSKSRKGFKGTL